MARTIRFIINADIGDKQGGGYVDLKQNVCTEKGVEDVIKKLKPFFDTKITSTTKILGIDMGGFEGLIFKGVRVQEVKEYKSYYTDGVY